MKYCPKCGSEFLDAVDRCETCNTRLIDREAWETLVTQRKAEDDEVFVTVLVLNDQFEADVIKDALENENIPVLVRPFQDTSFDGIFETQKGWGIVMVPNEYRDQANRIIKEIDSAGKP